MPDKTMKWAPKITPAALPYLTIQQGRISEFKGWAWRTAYEAQIAATLDAIRDYVPQPLDGILDIGAGMGGIDAALVHELGTPDTLVAVIDGIDDDPVARAHDKSYSNWPVASEFLRANGVMHAVSIDFPQEGDKADLEQVRIRAAALEPLKVDLVLSIQAWGFHFEPRAYWRAAMAMSRPGTRWILDVRKDRAAWAAFLFATPRLEPLSELPGFTDKYTRMVFEVTP